MLACAYPLSAEAGAWNQAAGKGQVITTNVFSTAERLFGEDDDLRDIESFSKTEIRIWVEHGLTQNLTLVGNTGLQDIGFVDDTSRFAYNGLDDIELGAQFEWVRREGLAVSTRLSYIVDSRLDNQVVDVLPGGDQAELRFLLGQSRETNIGDFFYDAQWALRTERFSTLDASQASLTLGYKPDEDWMIMAQGVRNASRDMVVDGFPVVGQRQIIGQLSLVYQIKPGRRVQFGVGQTLFGRNIVRERQLSVSVWTAY